ncbi:MAG: TatD family hydrolase [Methanobrevibacter sp.]|jgi:TatD DNase family protein|nr:TatD family hydrolase [Methanobrevibacter sp.]
MIDTHCHLDFENFDKNREEVIKRAKKKLTSLINSGTSFQGNINTLKLSNENPDFIYPSLGFHPIQSADMNDSEVNKVLYQISNYIDDIVAIGEVGIDFFYVKDKIQRNRQMDIFKRFCSLANEHEKPIIIHCRDGEKKAFNIINQFDRISDVIFHCYSGSLKTAKKIMDNGYYMSSSTMIDYSTQHQELFREIPLEYILTETDSPYLHPIRGEMNEPSCVKIAINKLAEIKEVDYTSVNKITENNAKKIFKI